MSTIAKKKPVPSRKRLADLNADGDYELVAPLDYMILDQLQDEGTLMGGYYPLADSVPALVKKFPGISTSTMSARMRVMHLQKLVTLVRTAEARTKGAWQRTELGKEVLAKWQSQQQ